MVVCSRPCVAPVAFGFSWLPLNSFCCISSSVARRTALACWLQGGAVAEEREVAISGRARKSARSSNDSLSLNAYRAKSTSKKA